MVIRAKKITIAHGWFKIVIFDPIRRPTSNFDVLFQILTS